MDCNSELAREKMWSRIYLIPALTAEEDRDLARRHYADQAREKQLLGGNTSPYNSDKYAHTTLDREKRREWNADGEIDTFAQHLRLPRQRCRTKGIGREGERCIYGKPEGMEQAIKSLKPSFPPVHSCA